MNPYDEIPYPIYSHSQTHPASLATLAILHGLTPPPVERCRVLELGCASGGNLIPMALSCPESRFVGVDLSARQIAVARSWAGAVGLKNVVFQHADLLSLGDELGEFDYLISHGLYSWVGREAQEKILEICHRRLAPNGVAFVSYNTLPGWRALSATRDLLRYHTRETDDLQARASRARGLLEWLNQELAKPDAEASGLAKLYGDFLRFDVERLVTSHQSYVLHEMLEEVNDPIYFHEFIERAARHSLQFLAEMDFRWSLPSKMPERLAQGLRNIARDWLEWEQYCDFLKGRTFRQTLLVHQGVRLSRLMKAEELSRLYLASSVKPVGEADIHSAAVQVFADAKGLSVSSDHPVTKAALIYLADIYPRLAAFQDVFRQACQRLHVPADPESNPRAALDARMLCNNLFTAFTASARLIELSAFAPTFVTEVSERPAASAWARIQAQDGFSVTNLRHERVELDPVAGYVLPYVDGSRDLMGLVDALIAGPVAAGKMRLKHQETPLTEPEAIRPVLLPEVEEALTRLARSALLIS